VNTTCVLRRCGQRVSVAKKVQHTCLLKRPVTSSSVWKSIISLKDQLVVDYGGQHQAIALMTTWSSEKLPFTAQTHDFLRYKYDLVPWAKVVWETWYLLMYNFILWLAVMEKLRTHDRLRFLDIDPLCVLCRLDDETHNHLFFRCPWTSLLWRMAKSWLRLHRSMSTINSVIRGFLSSRNNLVGRMRRVSLGILIYLIWEDRNKRIFDNSCIPVSLVFHRFQNSCLFLFVGAASVSFAAGDGFSRMGL